MLETLFGKKETLEEIIIKKPFHESSVHKRLSKFELDVNNPFLLHLCAKNDCADAISYLVRKQNINVNALNADGENALFIAIQNNAASAARALIVDKVDIEHTNLRGTSVLHLAAKHNLMDIFNILLNTVKDMKQVDKYGRNVLFYAIQSTNIDMVKRVLDITDIDINYRDNEDNTISHLKEAASSRELLNILLKQGLNIDALNSKNEDFIYINCLDLNLAEDIIHYALKKSININKEYELIGNNILRRIINKILSIDIQIFENKSIASKYQDRFLTFLDHGIDVNSLNEDDENILFEIVRSGNDLVLEFMLNRTRVNINQINKYGQNLLDIAIFYVKPNNELIKALIYSNIDCTMRDKDNFNVIEKLVDLIMSDALPNRPRKVGKLKSFKNVNYNQVLNLILDYSKIDINTLTFDDDPIIFEVANSFYTPLLEVFKKYGANLNIKSKKTNLNIYYKVLEAGRNAKDEKILFLKTLNFLVASNVDLDFRDSFGGTVIHKAILDHDLQVITVLTKKVVDFSSRDRKGRTYIHNTVWSEKVDVLKKIAFKDRNLINTPDKFGLLPINYAVIMGKKDIVFTLIKLGAYLNNPNKINEQFKEQFFCKLGRLDDILNSSMSANERTLMTKLVKSMQEELNIN